VCVCVFFCKNKEAEAKEELKRRAKQLEMQRREQQRRAAAAGGIGGGGNYLGGGISGYAPVPQRFDPPAPARQTSPAPSSLRSPTFKSGGMKLGSKRTKQAELLDALGGEVLAAEDLSAPATPAPAAELSLPVKDYTQTLPTVAHER
jgi:coatomer subunit delta